MNCHVVIGYTLPKERWEAAAENIKTVAPSIAHRLEVINFEGQGKQDAKDFMDDVLLAITALHYVAEAATDKCRFLPMPEREKS